MTLTEHHKILLAVESDLGDEVGLSSIVVACMSSIPNAFRPRGLAPDAYSKGTQFCSKLCKNYVFDIPLRVCSELAWKCRFTMLAFMYSTGASGGDSRHPMLSPPVVEQVLLSKLYKCNAKCGNKWLAALSYEQNISKQVRR